MRRLPQIAGAVAVSAALMAGHLPAVFAQSASSASSSTGNNNGVTICHRTGNDGHETIRVAPAAMFAHIFHGDSLGACDTSSSSASSVNSASSLSSPSSVSSVSSSSVSPSSVSSSSVSSSMTSSSVSSMSGSSLSSSTGSSLSSSSMSGSSVSSMSSSSSSSEDNDGNSFGRFRVNICHNPDGDNPRTVRVSIGAALRHLFHGDDFGRCDTDDDDEENA